MKTKLTLAQRNRIGTGMELKSYKWTVEYRYTIWSFIRLGKRFCSVILAESHSLWSSPEENTAAKFQQN